MNGDIDVNSFIDHVHLNPDGTLKLTENILAAVFDIKQHVAPCAVISQRQNAIPISKVLELYPYHPKHPDDHQQSSTSQLYGRHDTPGRDRMYDNHQRPPTSRSSYPDRRGPPRRDQSQQQRRQSNSLNTNRNKRWIPSREVYGCEFCGERNHRRSNCRYGGPLTCYTCGQMGHKARTHERETNSEHPRRSYYRNNNRTEARYH